MLLKMNSVEKYKVAGYSFQKRQVYTVWQF
jgi:hypothetical protein